MPEQEISPRRQRSQLSLIIIIFAIALIAAGGYWAWDNYIRFESEPAPVAEEPMIPPTPQMSQYASSTMKVSLAYPENFTLQEPYAYTRVSADKPISGAKFVVPSSMVLGTNLEPDSGISVEQLPRASVCTGDIYLKANVRARAATDGALTYSLATSTETAGTDVFEEMVYAIPDSSPCVAVRYFLHSSALASAATGTREFDRSAILTAFDDIRRSLAVQP